jgi:hypothetical protein
MKKQFQFVVVYVCAAVALLLFAITCVMWINGVASRDAAVDDTPAAGVLQTLSPEHQQLKDELASLLEAQHAALHAGELDLAMGYVHTASPVRTTTREVFTCVVKHGPPEIEMSSCVFMSADENQARVRAVHHYRFADNRFYRDTLADEIHTFRKENGTWKLWRSECQQKTVI